jgi:hypothetical protein
MDIENCAICLPCSSDDNMEELLDSMDSCSVNNQPLTIYIATLLERLTKEMIITKEYDEEACGYILKITPPSWFNTISEFHQNILIKLIEPVLNEYNK